MHILLKWIELVTISRNHDLKSRVQFILANVWIHTLCVINTAPNKRASLRGIWSKTSPVSWWWCYWVILFDTEEKVAVCNLMVAGSTWFVIAGINGHRGALNCLFPRDFCVACWDLFPRCLLSLQHCFQFHNLHHQPNLNGIYWNIHVHLYQNVINVFSFYQHR